MDIQDYELFKFGNNHYSEFINNGKSYLLNDRTYLDIVLTDYCNANCNFCIADLIHKKLNASLDVFKEKIKYAVDNMNVKEVLLLGGEPTMSKILIPMIQWLKTLNLDKIVMTTNGIRLAQDPEYRYNVLSSGITHLNLSFMSIDNKKQAETVNSKHTLSVNDISNISYKARYYKVKLRINNNIFRDNNDSVNDIIDFYNAMSPYADSIKFSPLLETDSFSVINKKTVWAKNNRLSDEKVRRLFELVEYYFTNKYNVSVIENKEQFGFVKNSMIPLLTPIILNWNFGNYTGMMKKVTIENKINNIKLLPNNELSLSWNRELPEYFIHTN